MSAANPHRVKGHDEDETCQVCACTLGISQPAPDCPTCHGTGCTRASGDE